MNGADASKCAGCGKIGDRPKRCTACGLMNCRGDARQEAHLPKHEREYKERAAVVIDEDLFQEQPKQDCPICFLPFSQLDRKRICYPCCSKTICDGCFYAISEVAVSKGKPFVCPFCRTPLPTSDEEAVGLTKRRMESNDAMAFARLAGAYCRGCWGLPRDLNKALELWSRAGKLGCARANYNVGLSYFKGIGVQRDEVKATYHFGLAAMRGDIEARHWLGKMEMEAGNVDRAMNHFLIAARAGYDNCLKDVKQGFLLGHVTKDDYEMALRSYQKSQDQMKSGTREKAAAALLS